MGSSSGVMWTAQAWCRGDSLAKGVVSRAPTRTSALQSAYLRRSPRGVPGSGAVSRGRRTDRAQLTPAGTSLAWLLPRNRHETSNTPTPRKAGQVIRRCTLTARHGNSGEAVACRALHGRSRLDSGHRSSMPRPDPDAGSQDTPRGDVWLPDLIPPVSARVASCQPPQLQHSGAP
jgi:hypothetical protein